MLEILKHSCNHSENISLKYLRLIQNYVFVDFEHVGCWEDRKSRAVPILERSDDRLRDTYWNRKAAIEKCYVVARENGLRIFSIQNGGQCFGSADRNVYKKYGRSTKCKNMKGGDWANDVYTILNAGVFFFRYVFS